MTKPIQYSIDKVDGELLVCLWGNAPLGTEGYEWAKPAILAFKKALNENIFNTCRVNMKDLEYKWGDFIMEFVVEPAVMRQMKTVIVANNTIKAGMDVMAHGIPNLEIIFVGDGRC